MQKINFYEAAQRQQLLPYLQPIVTLASGEVSGLEVRVRWRGNTGRTLTAGDVLKAAVHAEESWSVDQEMIKQANEITLMLRSQYSLSHSVAVNISTQTATNQDSIAELDKLLKISNFSTDHLVFELPFEAFCQAPDRLKELIKTLSAHGFAMTLDHVNSTEFNLSTGSESVCAIKLHEDLISTALDSPNSAKTIRAITEHAHKQGLTVMAEGLNQLNQIKYLRDVGCSQAQGPLIARPNTLGILSPLLKRGRCW